MRCVAFRCICNVLILHGTQCKMGWTCAINAQVCAIKSHWNFFATNAPDPPHWTLNSCFCGFRSVWVHLSMFRHYTKLGAKRVELVQSMHKFVPLSRIGIFHNERTQSTPLDPKLMFWSIL